VYFYLSGAAPDLYPNLLKIGHGSGLPMHHGEPEVAYAIRLAPSIYQMPAIRQAYDFFKAQDVDPKIAIPAGMSSAEYAAGRARTFSLVTEVPYFADDRVDDQTPTDVPRRQSLTLGLDVLREFHGIVARALAGVRLSLMPTPFLSAVEDLANRLPGQMAALQRWIISDDGLDRPATVAELFHSKTIMRFYYTLNLGMLARALEHPIDPTADKGVASVRQSITDLRNRWAQRILEESPCTPLPVRTLVAVQLASGLAAAQYLLARPP
jgi:hypothetical protein